jgi:hypothetical protein
MGRLSVHDALQHKLAVILAFVAFPPAIWTIAGLLSGIVFQYSAISSIL